MATNKYGPRTVITMGPAPCYDFAVGVCKRGSACRKSHSDALDPKLESSRPHDGYRVPNQTGEACLRCMQAGKECDKKGRGGSEDPCSECRWFGGPKCECLLSVDVSYNDVLFRRMLSREPKYDLPQFKAGDATVSDKKTGEMKFPASMADEKVMLGWQGKTKDQLFQVGDYLPDGVRLKPRAYLVPPRDSRGAKDAASLKRMAQQDQPTPMDQDKVEDVDSHDSEEDVDDHDNEEDVDDHDNEEDVDDYYNEVLSRVVRKANNYDEETSSEDEGAPIAPTS